jgi:hypothetical protein
MLHLTMNGPTPNSRQIYAMFGRDERTLKLMRQPRVHLTYQTAFVDDAGKLELRDDLYGMDARIHAILHSDERKIADVPPPQDPKRDLATAKSNQEILRRVERREALNPFHFFEQLFRYRKSRQDWNTAMAGPWRSAIGILARIFPPLPPGRPFSATFTR